MHFKCLSPEARELMGTLGKTVRGHEFILAGGTGLALHLGHRISVDLDFFTRKAFSTEKVFQEMKRLGLNPKVLEESEGSLTVAIDGIKVSMFRYPYPFIEKMKDAGGVPVAGIIDIASMKMIAISQRGARRDFFDLYFILQDIPFRKIAENMAKRFGADRINPVHIGKSLVFFNDADSDPDPRLLGKNKPPLKWERVKKFFIRNVRQMVLDMERARG
ncbi:MAG: nucleotidyl transferase AbiEii/AbiGii toxin family protein [Deltaproteobacteria bacterium]|nr:nucleotidyl transferase AbiEii/AbiGii toxin family protein [Deltaproteobacteria bacterium]